MKEDVYKAKKDFDRENINKLKGEQMTFKTANINTNDLVEQITNLYEVLTIILMEGQIRSNRYTDKEYDMRTEVISMAISKVMIEIFPPKEVNEIFALIQKKLDDKKRTKEKVKKINKIIKPSSMPN